MYQSQKAKKKAEAEKKSVIWGISLGMHGQREPTQNSSMLRHAAASCFLLQHAPGWANCMACFVPFGCTQRVECEV
jgi:hypothetical protein